MKKRLLHYTLAALLLLTGLPMAAQRVRAATYTVTNTNDSGAGSLREAIINANYTSGTKSIAFNIPTSDPGYSSLYGVWTITLSSRLPALTSSNIIIDGATQAANQGDTNPAGPEVQIDGYYLGAGEPIFLVTSSWNQILGLAITYAAEYGVYISAGALGNRVKDSYIGIGPDGWSDAGNGIGVIIVAASENIIANNVISWNDQYGIHITGSSAEDNMIRRNTIGLNALGTGKAPNGSHGVYIAGGARDNIVGGLYGEEGYRNTISGNGGHGVYISGGGTEQNYIGYNYIGVDGTGTGSHVVGNGGSGVVIDGGASYNAACYNVISGNGEHGVYISGSGTYGNQALYNIVGADAQTTALVPNGKHGVAIYNGAASNETYGGVIVGNSWSGVAIVSSNDNKIQGSAIGTDKDFWSGAAGTNLGNNYYGVHVVDGSGNHVGLSHIAYNGILPGRAGVRVEGAGATGNTISTSSIHDNSGKGIELVDGGNAGRSAPTITQASCQQVQGSTCAGCTVQIFSDGADEGRIYEGETTAHAILPTFFWSGLVDGPNVTVTVTDHQDNTSEFSAPVYVGLCNKVYLPLVLR